jgi:hypothetical protein
LGQVRRAAQDVYTRQGAAPVTVNEVKDRFDAFLASLTKGTESSKVRIIIRP